MPRPQPAVPPRQLHKAEQRGVPAHGAAISRSLTGLAIHDLGGLYPACAPCTSCLHLTCSKLWPGVSVLLCKQHHRAGTPLCRRPLRRANPVPSEDGVPFAVALSLFKRQPEGAAAGEPPDQEPSLHQLQYVLDGSGLVGEQFVPSLSCADDVMLPGCLQAASALHQL